jgi:hypothetical protein
MESVASLGRFDFGIEGQGARIVGTAITFIAPDDTGSSGAVGVAPGIHFHIASATMLQMENCGLNTGNYPLKIWNVSAGSSRIKLSYCTIQTPGENGKVQIGFDKHSADAAGKQIEIDTIIVRPTTGNVFQDTPKANKWYTAGSYDNVTFTQGINATSGSFTTAITDLNWQVGSDPTQISKGDLIYVESGGSGTDFQAEQFVESGVGYAQDFWGTIGTVDSVASSGTTRTVTVKHIHKGFPFNTSCNVRRFRWTE